MTGQALGRLRRAAGLTQEGLAHAAGVPVGTLRNWEQGRFVPRLDTAARVARALGADLGELAGDSVEATPPPRRHQRKGDRPAPDPARDRR